MITYKVLDNTLENAHTLEHLRLSSYDFIPTKEDYDEYYIEDICNGRILPITCYYNDLLVAGCYVSNTFNTIYIDYLFVLPEYQEKGLQLGRNLLLFILENKHIIEEYFETEFSESRLCATTDKTKAIYKKIGYKELSEEMMSKTLNN